MSTDINTDGFFEFDPSGDSTVLRIIMTPEQVTDLLLAHEPSGHLPSVEHLDEVHVLISDAAIKRAYDDIPRPDLELPENHT